MPAEPAQEQGEDTRNNLVFHSASYGIDYRGAISLARFYCPASLTHANTSDRARNYARLMEKRTT